MSTHQHNKGARGLSRVWATSVVLALAVTAPLPVHADNDVPAAGASDIDEGLATVPRRKMAPPAAGMQEMPAVNLNTASVAELMFLPRVGQKKAEAIVARRERRKFSRPEEIMEVKGFGRATYRKLKPFLRTHGPTTATAKLKLEA